MFATYQKINFFFEKLVCSPVFVVSFKENFQNGIQILCFIELSTLVVISPFMRANTMHMKLFLFLKEKEMA